MPAAGSLPNMLNAGLDLRSGELTIRCLLLLLPARGTLGLKSGASRLHLKVLVELWRNLRLAAMLLRGRAWL